MSESERKQEPDTRMSDALKTIEMMEILIANDGWKYLCVILQSHIDSRFSTIIEQRFSMDELISQEYFKGECKAYIFMKKLPMIMIDDSKQRIKELTGDSDE